jgi:linoleoyl-CoA desaturase
VIDKLTPLKFITKDHTDFLKLLRERIDIYFLEKGISNKYNSGMVIKSVFMLSLYIIPFIYYVVFAPSLMLSIFLWSIMALGVAGIGMCIMHDANHGAYVKSYKLNHFIGKVINLLGGSEFNWKIQHNILHHTYTNIVHYDDDIDDKAILKLSPNAKSKWYHKYQHYYAFVFYSIATLYWCTVKDFIQLNRYTKEGLNKNSKTENFWLWIELIVSKLVYFTVLFLTPYYISDISISQTLICFLVMHAISGLILTTVFQLAHTVDNTIHPTPTKDHIIKQTWAVHQMQTTSNFARNNTFISWWVGGLNFQIEHHLFPNICHVHYPQLAPIVKQTAEEFGIPYLEFETVGIALKSHIRALKLFGN